MFEFTKKTPLSKRSKFNPLAIRRLSEKYNVTPYFVRESLNKNKTSQTSDNIRTDYKKVCQEIEEALKKV